MGKQGHVHGFGDLMGWEFKKSTHMGMGTIMDRSFLNGYGYGYGPCGDLNTLSMY